MALQVLAVVLEVIPTAALGVVELQIRAVVVVVVEEAVALRVLVVQVTQELLIGHKEINNGTFNRVRTRIY
jgi:hypothetical protein